MKPMSEIVEYFKDDIYHGSRRRVIEALDNFNKERIDLIDMLRIIDDYAEYKNGL